MKLASRNKRIFLLSNYSVDNETYIRGMIHELGGEVTDLGDDFRATHLVVPFMRTTPKMLAALAAGIWIVQTSYVMESYKLGHWDLEAGYEIGSESCPYYILNEGDDFSTKKKYEDAPRICREKALVRNRPNFADWKVGLAMEPKKILLHTKWILQAGGAMVLELTFPISTDNVDFSFIDFAVVMVENLSSVAPLINNNILCVPYSYIADSLCKDPPPDITKYDCLHPTKKEERVRRSERNLGDDSSSRSKKHHTHETSPSRNEECHYPGKDNFQITLNSSRNFLMNTAISVTVDFNPRLAPKAGVNSNDGRITELKPSNSSGAPSQCTQNVTMCEYYSQGSYSPQKEHSENKSSGNWDSLNCSGSDDFIGNFQPSSPRKRVLSPRNGLDSNKRRKSHSPQKNKIFKYFIRTDGKKVENSDEREIENVSYLESSNTADSTIFGETSKFNSVQKTCKNNSTSRTTVYQSLVEHQCERTSELEVIVISSDEETGSNASVVKGENEIIARQATCTNALVARDVKLVTCMKTEDHSSNARIATLNLIANSGESIEHIISLVSSDEEGDTYFQQKVIDLNCDNFCDLDDAGGVIVPESKRSERSSLDDVDDDDDCISEVSCKRDVISEEIKPGIEEEPDIYVIDDNSHETNLSVSTCKRRRISSESRTAKFNLPDSQMPSSVSDPEVGSEIEELCSKVEFIDLLERERNTSDMIEVQDDDTSDSSLPSPPPIFKDNVNMHDGSTNRINQVALCRESSNYEDDKRTGSRLEYAGLAQEMSCEKNETYLSSCVPVESVSDHDRVSQCENIIDQLSELRTGASEEGSSNEMDIISSSTTINPSAMRVCQVQAEVLLSKLYQPWIDLDTRHLPQCCIMGPAKCNSLHGKKGLFPEEAEYYDEDLILRMECGKSAIALLRSRLDFATYPSLVVVQHVLLCCMDLWVAGITNALCWLQALLEQHPPCAFGMLDYYRKILFSPVQDMRAPDGTFWCCVTKIEDIMNEIEKQSKESGASLNTDKVDQGSFSYFEHFLENPPSSCNQEVHEVDPSIKLSQLFSILEYLINIMEADLTMGLLKNISNLKRYTCKTGRPLIAVALWGTHGAVGNVNVKCRHLMKLYLRTFEAYSDLGYHQCFRRLISLTAGVTNASERNSEPPKYPNIDSNCKEFASTFTSIMMTKALNMSQVYIFLNTLRPDWFRVCVCSNLLEKLYGRNMEISLQPTVTLLKKLYALNQEFPSEEEISKTLLSDPDDNCAACTDTEELPPTFVKQATKKDKKGETRLHIACRRNNVTEVEKLLCVPQISINEKDNMGWTPLHEAACHGSVECVKKLLNFRTPSGGPAVDLRVKNNAGVTPLMDAVLKNHLEVAFVLLQYGGQELLSDENEDGRSAWDYAHTEEMKNVLKNASDHNGENDLLFTIPRTLYVKLAVLTPLTIICYIKFSEVTKIVKYLKNNTELVRDGASLVKFQPIAFKQDYLEYQKLQTFLKENVNNCNKLVSTLIIFTLP